MLSSFFALAALSPGRQSTFRQAVIAHLLVLGGAAAALWRGAPPSLLGHVLLVAGIVEGAVLLGWRLTQLPRSQALEFYFVTLLPPGGVFLAEAFVGLARLALVTLAGLPVLVLLADAGLLAWVDLPPLLLMPLTWGAVAGLGLTTWAYEPRPVRRWAERVTLGLILLYLVVGVLVGEHLKEWLGWLPADLGRWVGNGFEAVHRYNPFAVLEFWLKEEPSLARDRVVGLEAAALAGVGLLLARAARRFKPHFQDRHYQPRTASEAGRGAGVGDRPLTWWAVRRVLEYSGRINLWLAGGFGLVYALYTVAGPWWPPYLGRGAFELLEQQAGGIPGIAAALIVLAAVPAAFQYGLWDSNAQDRCRRLELLLLTRLEPADYWHAAASAAWRRGRGYFAVAVLLWASAAVAGRISPVEVGVAVCSGVVLWGLYFAAGFQAFARGLHANRLGLLLTTGLPLLTYALYRAGWPALAALLPPGSVYAAPAGTSLLAWLLGPLVGAVVTVVLARTALARCDGELRRWYDRHHGRKVLD